MAFPVRFPHFQPVEEAILKRYIANGAPSGDWTTDYRLAILEKDVPATLQGSDRDMWIALHQKRIDALVETPTTVYIIEVKARVTSTAVGQLLVYAHLYKSQTLDSRPIELVLVAGEDDPIAHQAIEAQGVTVIVA
jgi:nicotinamide riboside kinase